MADTEACGASAPRISSVFRRSEFLVFSMDPDVENVGFECPAGQITLRACVTL
jgi:hypothetical protein